MTQNFKQQKVSTKATWALKKISSSESA